MFLKNCWYVAAWDHELGDAPLARTLLGEPVVFFRDADGAPAALEDRCSHRSAPLSNGTVEGDNIRCGYHGLLFGRDGGCREVPGQSMVPPGSAIQSYPVIEKWRWIWIWMGDPAQADENLIPDFHWNDDPEWVSQGDRFHVGGDYRLLVDNLLDLSHVQYVHASTLGTEAVVDFPIETRRDGDLVHVDRWIMDGPPPPMFQKAAGITGDVDRWQLITWNAPSHIVIDVGCAAAGTGASQGNRDQGVTMYSNHSITPETEKSCHYFWHHARNFNLEDEDLTAFLRKATGGAFFEDVDIIERQQKSIDSAPDDFTMVDINADAGVLQASRILDRLISEETA
ncbi:MAG: aromatic ring-hydroxylating dioxygenase subunit alpha [Rhodospirillales bacterium]|nr:aromatic ring-hydroxylating dioxygenase subunit alpha [Rhodospirillales bacterium]